MVHSISYRTTLCLCAMLLCFKAAAQSYVTYNHDATKMNQITVQEIGVGGLTPAFYYTLFHNSYQKSAASKNKLSFSIAWLAEGSKVNNKLSDFEKNINRIISSGGTVNDKTRWNEYYNMFRTAIKETQDAYMPNAQRKRQYLAIYADIEHQNEILIAYLIQLSNRNKTASLLAARLNRRTDVASHATEAFSRWREAGQLNSEGHN